MTDEQTAAEIMADTGGDPRKTRAAIVRALQQAREEGRRDESRSTSNMIRLGALAQCTSGILDCTGKEPVVRRVLGTLPVTEDGCVIGDDCTVFREDVNYEKMNRPRFYEFDVGRNRTRVETWSTREAAEAAKEAQK